VELNGYFKAKADAGFLPLNIRLAPTSCYVAKSDHKIASMVVKHSSNLEF